MKLRMERAALAFLIIMIGLCLAGCGLRDQAREVDQLLIVQTLGFDTGGPGLVLSLSSRGRTDSPPERLLAAGASITEALERVRTGTNEEELFSAHLGHLLIGEAAAGQGIAPCLDYVCRSGNLRLNVPVYVLRGAQAQEAVLSAGNESFGASDALDAVDADLRDRGDGRVTTATGLLRDLARYDSALVSAVALRDSAENDQRADAGERPRTLVPAGYAVLREGRLCGFLDREQALGVGFLTGQAGLAELVVTDQAGLPVTLSITGGSSELEPRFDEGGGLCALSVSVKAEAVLAESAAGDTELSYLQTMAERAISDRVRQTLQLSKLWQADFLGLEGILERRAPERMRAQDPAFAVRWPSLPLTVSVSVRLTGTGDVEDAP